MRYRRKQLPGACYFFTLVTYERRPLFSDENTIELLRKVIQDTKLKYPFKIDAMVVMPDHLHCILTLPEKDIDYSLRWGLIKSNFSRLYNLNHKIENNSLSRKNKREQCVWQRRFWEHLIRDENDFANHADYIHYNPVKHGLVRAAKDWPYSSFKLYVKREVYTENWRMDSIDVDNS